MRGGWSAGCDFGDRAFKIFNFQTVREHPYDCIGALYFTNRYGETNIGTGFLIGPDLVLTSANNVYSRQLGAHVGLRFYPGVSGEFEGMEMFGVVGVRMRGEYASCEEEERNWYDYALLKLEREVRREAYLELAVDCSQPIQEMGIAGYRRDAHSENSAIQFALWKHDALSLLNSPLLAHKLSCFDGNSGSPLLVNRLRPVAIALHTGAQDALNVSRLITADLAADLLGWEREMAFFKSAISFNRIESSSLSCVEEAEIISRFPVKVNLAESRLPAPVKRELPSPNKQGSTPTKRSSTPAKLEFSTPTKQRLPLQSTRRQEEATIPTMPGSGSRIVGFTSVAIFNDFCKKMDQERVLGFNSRQVEFSTYSTVKDLTEHLSRAFQEDFLNAKQYPPRLWLVRRGLSAEELFINFKQTCKMSPTFEYKLYLDGELLKDARQLSRYSIDGSSLIMIEFRNSPTWMLYNERQPLEGACPYCRGTKELGVMCECRGVVYCSEKCKGRDQFAHRKRCPVP